MGGKRSFRSPSKRCGLGTVFDDDPFCELLTKPKTIKADHFIILQSLPVKAWARVIG